ncbi:hypothetical protein F4778DRAFT_722202 [Xylariomycetidae sp. FL2044]|nr:hypothetical protein F4778DRAFT_722202 [Xylariomycetidae sp. FL2044]
MGDRWRELDHLGEGYYIHSVLLQAMNCLFCYLAYMIFHQVKLLLLLLLLLNPMIFPLKLTRVQHFIKQRHNFQSR